MGLSSKTHWFDGDIKVESEKKQLPEKTRYVCRTVPVQVKKYTWLMEKSKM